MSIKENLIAAKALIDTPEKWIKYDLRNDDRTCFCAIGAVEKAINLDPIDGDLFNSPEVMALAASLVEPSDTWTDLSFYNDRETTTHADIMALFDRAIEAQS